MLQSLILTHFIKKVNFAERFLFKAQLSKLVFFYDLLVFLIMTIKVPDRYKSQFLALQCKEYYIIKTTLSKSLSKSLTLL